MGSSAEFRFAVVRDDGAASEPWRLWTSEAGDAYVAIRALGGHAKVSLHASGDWRYGFTAERPDGGVNTVRGHRLEGLVVRNTPGGGAPSSARVIREWRRPPRSAGGYVVALRLVVPLLSCTRPPTPSTPKKPVVHVPVPHGTPSSMTVTFHLIVSPVDDRTGYPMPAGDAPSTLVERLVLGDEYLWVIASIDPLHQGLMEGAIVGFGEFISRADNEAFLTEDGARLIAFGHTDDEYETPFMIDLDPLLAVASWQTWLDEQRGSDVEKRRGLELGHAIVAARRARGQLPT